jgi:hypothetical protein
MTFGQIRETEGIVNLNKSQSKKDDINVIIRNKDIKKDFF